MANEVRIKVAVDSKEAQKDLKDVKKKVGETTPGITGMKNAFGGLTKAMALFGVGALSVGLATSTIVRESGAAAKAAANIEKNYERLPESLKKAFDEMVPFFPELADKFNILEDDIALAMLNLLTSTRMPNIGLLELEGLLGRVASGEGNLAAETEILIQALLGSPAAIKTITGNFQSIEQSLRDSAKAGVDAQTVFNDLSFVLRGAARDAGSLFDALSRGDYRTAFADFKTILFDVASIIGSRPFAFLTAGLNPARLATLLLKDAMGEIPSVLEIIRGIGASKPFQWIIDQTQSVSGWIATLLTQLSDLAGAVGRAAAAPFRSGGAPLRVGAGSSLPTPQPRPTARINAKPGPLPSVDTFDEGGFFDDGGVVDGAPGTHQRIIAKAGERVLTEPQQAAMMGPGSFTFIMQGDVDSEARLDAMVREVQDKLTQFNRGGQGT